MASDRSMLYSLDLPKGSLVLDGGAHRGQELQAAADLGLRIVSFEPRADLIAHLWKQFPDADIRHGALATYDGTVLLHSTPRDEGWTTEPHKIHSQPAYEVPAFNIAFVVDELRPNLLKLDVEGSEWDLLAHLLASGTFAMLPDMQVRVEDHVTRVRDLDWQKRRTATIDALRTAEVNVEFWD